MPEPAITYEPIDAVKNRPPGIRCLLCGRTSYNANDVREKFCGACHRYHTGATMQARLEIAQGLRTLLGAAWTPARAEDLLAAWLEHAHVMLLSLDGTREA